MLITIGLIQSPAPLTFEADITEDALLDQWEEARAQNGLLKLTDTKGDRISVVPTAVTFIQVREDKALRVGFGRD